MSLSKGSYGRVQVTFNGTTGTICDDKWTDTDAMTVCKQLGFAGGLALKGSYYGKGTGPVFLNNMLCRTTDETIWHCKGDTWQNVDKKCLKHDNDASAICHKGTSTFRFNFPSELSLI